MIEYEVDRHFSAVKLATDTDMATAIKLPLILEHGRYQLNSSHLRIVQPRSTSVLTCQQLTNTRVRVTLA